MSLSDIQQRFQQYGGKATPFFTLNGMKTYARVCSVYDGDTITVVMDVNGSFLKFKCRLMGIDTCEIKSKNAANKELAMKARNRLIELITGKKVEDAKKKDIEAFLEDEVHLIWIHCLEFDKFGRTIIECYSSPDATTSFNQTLVAERLAYSYGGDTKLTEEQQVALLTAPRP
jgi:endonuclease YncB( thermonuclease family)